MASQVSRSGRCRHSLRVTSSGMAAIRKRCGALAYGASAIKQPTFSSTEYLGASGSSRLARTGRPGRQRKRAAKPSGCWDWSRTGRTRRHQGGGQPPSGGHTPKITNQYLEVAKRKQRPRTHSEVARYLLIAWKPLHSLSVFKISRRHIAARVADIATEQGAVSAARARTALSTMFNWAIREGLDIAANPVHGTNRPEQPKSRDRVLSYAELAEIWQACGDDDYGRILRLLILTAQRRDEVGGMQWPELDTAAEQWIIPSARTKNHREHVLPLVPAALVLLPPRRTDRAYIFGDGPRREGDQHRGFSGWSKSKAALRCSYSSSAEGDRCRASRCPLDRARSSPHGCNRDGGTVERSATYRGGDLEPRERPSRRRSWGIQSSSLPSRNARCAGTLD